MVINRENVKTIVHLAIRASMQDGKPMRIDSIKSVRLCTGLGLKGAMQLVDAVMSNRDPLEIVLDTVGIYD